MTKKKKTWIIIGAVGGTIYLMFMIVLAAGLPWIILNVGLLLEEDPPQPAVTYAEFPFELVCEIDGEKVVVEDIYVCEYDGIGSNEGMGKYIKWKGYIKGTNEDAVLIKKVNGKKIYCSIGSPEYYMGDPNNFIVSNKPTFYSTSGIDALGMMSSDGLDQQELEQYGIKLIRYEFSNPIENSFE